MICLEGLPDGTRLRVVGVITLAGRTSKGKELATSFDQASLARANTQRAREARLLVMAEIAHTWPM
jgi:hypothetical protein